MNIRKIIKEELKILFEDVDIDLSLKNLNAFRNSTTYSDIRKLYDFLIEFRGKNKSFLN